MLEVVCAVLHDCLYGLEIGSGSGDVCEGIVSVRSSVPIVAQCVIEIGCCCAVGSVPLNVNWIDHGSESGNVMKYTSFACVDYHSCSCSDCDLDSSHVDPFGPLVVLLVAAFSCVRKIHATSHSTSRYS